MEYGALILVWHLYTILSEKRDQLQKYLYDHHIQTIIHYPIPIHRQNSYRKLRDLNLPITEKIHTQTLSLPLYPVLSQDKIDKIVNVINDFKKRPAVVIIGNISKS